MAKNQSVGRVSIELTADVADYVNKLHKADVASKGAFSKIANEMIRTGEQSKKLGKNLDGMAGRLRGMGQTAALVSGPMGGISSRLSVMATIVSQGPLIAGIAGVGLALTGLYIIIKNGVVVLDKELVLHQQLQATMRATGHAAGITTGEMESFAQSLAMNTLASVDDVSKAMGKLSTFINITGDNFFKTTKIAEDMAAAGFGSIIDNSVRLGKALSDPIKNLGALTKNGVTFTAQQKLNINTLTQQNNLFDAQSLILKTITAQLGDVANQQTLKTIAGQTDSLSQNWDNLTKVMGNVTHGPILNFLQALNEKIHALTLYLDPNFEFKLAAPKKAREEITALGLDMKNLSGAFDAQDMSDGFSKAIKQMKFRVSVLSIAEDAIKTKINSNIKLGAEQGLSNKEEKSLKIKLITYGKEHDALVKNLITLNAYKNQLNATKGQILSNVNKQNELIDKKRQKRQDSFNQSMKNAKTLADKETTDFIKSSEHQAKLIMEERKSSAAKKQHIAEIQKAKDEAYILDLNRKQAISDATVSSGLDVAAKAKGQHFADLRDLQNKYNTDSLALTDALNITKFEKDTTAYIILNQAKLALKENYDKQKSQLDLTYLANAGSSEAEIALENDKYAILLANYRAFKESKKLTDDEYNTIVQEGTAAHANKLLEIQVRTQSKQTKWATDTLTAMSDAFKQNGKEGTRIAKALFFVNKAIAFSDAIIATNKAATDALATDTTGATSTIIKIRGYANAATIAATGIAGAFHGGVNEVPQANDNQSFLLKAGERVVQPQANKDLTSFLKNSSTGTGVIINAPLTIQGNVTDQRWFQQELFKNRQLLAASVSQAKNEKPNRR